MPRSSESYGFDKKRPGGLVSHKLKMSPKYKIAARLMHVVLVSLGAEAVAVVVMLVVAVVVIAAVGLAVVVVVTVVVLVRAVVAVVVVVVKAVVETGVLVVVAAEMVMALVVAAEDPIRGLRQEATGVRAGALESTFPRFKICFCCFLAFSV
ncbi:hypothetical protein Cadr_000000611 [Camelus dromedarius]|uniref:Uncharacterized protein n=1 Tax=Camelus dromedarius TaxID=9838 RepID=A0A5N4EJN3_CAMDR|nr:hypothetical protein Cadr_000000611 [Camelus dromedarius]